MLQFEICRNDYLSKATTGFCHVPYTRMGNPGNPDYLNVLKNTFCERTRVELEAAEEQLLTALTEDIPQILSRTEFLRMTVCVVPRAKAETAYRPTQLLFRSKVRVAVRLLPGLEDGTDYIRRVANTRTTHLRNPVKNYNNDGPEPFPGITVNTCEISTRVSGKDVLLIDDIYTPGVNIDEDAIQALLTANARSVAFYAVGKV